MNPIENEDYSGSGLIYRQHFKIASDNSA